MRNIFKLIGLNIMRPLINTLWTRLKGYTADLSSRSASKIIWVIFYVSNFLSESMEVSAAFAKVHKVALQIYRQVTIYNWKDVHRIDIIWRAVIW